MALKISNEVKVAILAIVAIVLFFVGFNYLKGRGVFTSDKYLYSEYEDVSGLTPSSFVQLKGVNIGSVKEIGISPKDPSKVKVVFTVNEDVNFPNDSKVTISSADLLGTKVLKVTPGVSKIVVKDGEFLASYKEAGMFDAISDGAGKISDNASAAITNIDATVRNINSLIDEETKLHLQQSIKGLDASINNFKGVSDELNKQRAAISQTMNSLNGFAKNLSNNNQNINKIMSNAELTTNKLSKLELQQTINDLNKTIVSLNSTIAKINNNDGSIGLLMNDKKLYNNLQESLGSLNNLLSDLKANPKRYVSFSLIERKDKTPSTITK